MSDTNAMWDDPYSNIKAVAVFDREDTFVGLRGKRGEVIDLAYAQEIAEPGGSALVGHGGGTVEQALQAHADALANVEGNLNFTTLQQATLPVADTDLMLIRQGASNKKVDVSVIRSEFASDAVAAKNAAEAARDAAFVNANVYASTSAGLAAVADGVQFQVVSGDEIIRYVRTNSTTATEVARYPAASAVIGLKYTATNRLINSTLTTSDSWSATNGTINSATGGELTFTASAKLGYCRCVSTPLGTIGDVYYVAAKIKATSADVKLLSFATGTNLFSVPHSGSGSYELLAATAAIPVVAQPDVRVYDYRTSGWDAVQLKEPVVVNLTTLFGAGNEPTATEFQAMLAASNSGSTFFASTLLLDLIKGSKVYAPTDPQISRSRPMYVDITSGVLNVIFRYGPDMDMRAKFGQAKVNNLFDFIGLYKISNTSAAVSQSISAGSALMTANTDWFGPYQVAAVANADGDAVNLSFTGGNHGYDGTGSLSTAATASQLSLEFWVDGRKVTSYSGLATTLEVRWLNGITAYNTRKADGSGRQVFTESWEMRFDGRAFRCKNTIKFLEAANWVRYYGLQAQTNAWPGTILFRSGANRQLNAVGAGSNAGSKTATSIELANGTDRAEIFIDRNIDLGRAELLGTATDNAFESGAKVYTRMVGGSTPLSVAAGDTFTLEGGYRFWGV